MMQLCRQFENACNQAYMQGNIRGFMHLDNGQEAIPALIADAIKLGDKKLSYYRVSSLSGPALYANHIHTVRSHRAKPRQSLAFPRDRPRP